MSTAIKPKFHYFLHHYSVALQLAYDSVHSADVHINYPLGLPCFVIHTVIDSIASNRFQQSWKCWIHILLNDSAFSTLS